LKTKQLRVVAILDEDSNDRIVLQQAFEQCRQDIEVHSFEKASELVEYLSRSEANCVRNGSADLIIVALDLPWESTFDLIVTIKADHSLRHMPIIVLIGLVPEPLIKRLYDVGANTVIARPVLWDELVGVIKKTCDYWFGPLKM